MPGAPDQLDAVPWRETRYPGVAVHFYHSDKTTRRVLALIRMAPGCGYPAHRHTASEEVLVLQGSYRDELGTYRQGQLVRYEAGSEHSPRALDAGPACVLLALAHEGVKLLA
ncbi:MAG: cupin domain-containing protein [Planctomycetes bacterium]|nr:cupin domain-containing protein [Myxococcales bacterium]MCB9876406.1 cupin domain-containing protein [Planctomycetota bacterium]